MAVIYKRGNSWAYRVYYYDFNHKRHSVSKSGFKFKKEAEKEATLKENKKIKLGISNKDNISLTDYFENWIKTYKLGRLDQSTEVKYKIALKYIRKCFDDQPLKDITRVQYQNFIDNYASTHSHDGVIRINGYIRKCLKYATDDGIIYKDLTHDIVLKGTKPKSASLKFLEYNEAEKLKQHCVDEANYFAISKYMILTGLLTGMRFGEVAGLTWKDIDFLHKTININKTWDYHFYTGFKKTKTETSNRKIQVTDDLLKALKQLRIEQRSYYLKKNYHDKYDLVFRNKYFKIDSDNAVNYKLKSVLKKIGAINIITFHGLRHTHASILISKDIAIDYISERLGHSSTETTLRVYTHLLDNKRKKENKKALKVLSNL